MRKTLLIIGILSIILGLLIFSGAKSAIHEIEAFMLFLIAAVLIASSEIINSIDKLREKTK